MLTTEDFLCLLVEVGDSDPGGQYGIVWVFGCHSSSCFCSQSVQFNGGYSTVHTSYHLHGDFSLKAEGEGGGICIMAMKEDKFMSGW